MLKKFFDTIKKKPLTEQILDKSLKSIKLDRNMYTNARFALRNPGHVDMAKKVLEEDKSINKSERSVRRKLLTHFALADKVEIGSGFTISSIIIDIERIGDQAKNIADLVLLMDDKFTCDVYEKRIKKIESHIDNMFDKTILAFENNDADAAREVTKLYKNDVSKECSIIKDSLIKGEEPLDSGNATAIALYLRYTKRVGAHLYNISTSVLNPFPRIGYKEKK